MGLVRNSGFLSFWATCHLCPSSWKSPLFFPHENHLSGSHNFATALLLSLHCHFRDAGGILVRQLFVELPVGEGFFFLHSCPPLSPAVF